MIYYKYKCGDEMVLDKKVNFINYMLIGSALIILGIIQLVYKESIYILISFILGASILLSEIKNSYLLLFTKNNNINTLKTSFGVVLGILLLYIPTTSLVVVSLIVGFYFILHAVIKLIQLIIFIKDDIYNYSLLFQIIITLLFGIFISFTPIKNFEIVIVLLSLYFIILGVSNINDALKIIIPNKIKDKYKRKIKITIPAIVSAIIPLIVFRKINEQIELNTVKKYVRTNYYNDLNIKVLVHLRDDGFDSVGHLDIVFNDQVISYGNYDSDSRKFFNTIGDGILFKVSDKLKYIDFCINNNHKTIIEYEIKLSKKNYDNIVRTFKDIMKYTYSWYLPKNYNKNYYAYLLYKNTDAQFYKFKSGKFKTYFNFTTNCAMLVDKVLGATNTDILNINGIITPGTYYLYLEKEISKKNGIVIKKTIYR